MWAAPRRSRGHGPNARRRRWCLAARRVGWCRPGWQRHAAGMPTCTCLLLSHHPPAHPPAGIHSHGHCVQHPQRASATPPGALRPLHGLAAHEGGWVARREQDAKDSLRCLAWRGGQPERGGVSSTRSTSSSSSSSWSRLLLLFLLIVHSCAAAPLRLQVPQFGGLGSSWQRRWVVVSHRYPYPHVPPQRQLTHCVFLAFKTLANTAPSCRVWLDGARAVSAGVGAAGQAEGGVRRPFVAGGQGQAGGQRDACEPSAHMPFPPSMHVHSVRCTAPRRRRGCSSTPPPTRHAWRRCAFRAAAAPAFGVACPGCAPLQSWVRPLVSSFPASPSHAGGRHAAPQARAALWSVHNRRARGAGRPGGGGLHALPAPRGRLAAQHRRSGCEHLGCCGPACLPACAVWRRLAPVGCTAPEQPLPSLPTFPLPSLPPPNRSSSAPSTTEASRPPPPRRPRAAAAPRSRRVWGRCTPACWRGAPPLPPPHSLPWPPHPDVSAAAGVVAGCWGRSVLGRDSASCSGALLHARQWGALAGALLQGRREEACNGSCLPAACVLPARCTNTVDQTSLCLLPTLPPLQRGALRSACRPPWMEQNLTSR